MRDFEVPRGCDTLPGEVKEELWARKVDMRTRGKIRYGVLSPGAGERLRE